jgi:hypothetical protein
MRYPVLKLIVVVHYVLAAVGLLVLWLFCSATAMRMPVLGFVIVGGLVGVAVTIAVAEVLKLLMDIEANTRSAKPATATPFSALEVEVASATDAMRWASLSLVERSVLVAAVGLVLAVAVFALW